MRIFDEVARLMAINNFKKSFILTWFYLMIGFAFLGLFIVISELFFQNRSFGEYLIKNIGFLFLLVSLLTAYSAVYYTNYLTEGTGKGKRPFLFSIKLAPKQFLLVLIILFLISLVMMIQFGLSYVGKIPYAGYILVALLTIPYFLMNFLAIIIGFSLFLIIPPVIAEGVKIKNFYSEMKSIVKKEGAHLFQYLIISLTTLVLGLVIIYFIFSYAAGMTFASQSQLMGIIPPQLLKISSNWYLTDIINGLGQIKPIAASTLRSYGSGYVTGLQFTMLGCYFILGTFILAFPLAAYFSISSIFYKWLKR